MTALRMSRLSIYDSHGHSVYGEGETEVETAVPTFDRNGVLLYVDATATPRLVCSLLAKRGGPEQRTEQFYVGYRGNSIPVLFEAFPREVERAITELEWYVDTSSHSDRSRIYTALTSGTSQPLPAEAELEVFRWLIDRGDHVDVGVPTPEQAVALVRQFTESGVKVAVGRGSRAGNVSDVSLFVKTDETLPRIVPLGETRRRFAETQRRIDRERTTSRLDATLSDLTDVVRSARDDGTLQSDELRRRLDTTLRSALPGTRVTSASELGIHPPTAPTRTDRRVPFVVGFGAAILLVAGVVVVLLVVGVPVNVLAPVADAVPFVGGVSPAAPEISSTSYDSGTGHLQMEGTATDGFLTVSITAPSGESHSPVYLKAADGRFALDERLDFLLDQEREAIEPGEYSVVVATERGERDESTVLVDTGEPTPRPTEGPP